VSFFHKAAADGGIGPWQMTAEQFAQQLEPALRDAFLAAIARISDGMDLDAVESAIAAGNIEQVLTLLGLGSPTTPALGGVGTAAIAAVIRAGQMVADDYAVLPMFAPRLAVHFGFDALNPQTVQHLQAYSLGLIQQIGGQTREGIRQALDAGYKAGQNPRDTARDIRDMIGLTDRQEQAVQNFRGMLKNGHPDALQRKLRDRRFDRSVKAAVAGDKTLASDKIDVMVKRYRERFLKYRAEAIARTESIRALNVGQQEAWRQMAAGGKIDAGLIRRIWLVAHDERACPRCRPIPKLNPQGVGLERPFQTPGGPVMMPPLHPSCRCTVFYRVLEPAMTWQTAA
jgi:hypothetical protein